MQDPNHMTIYDTEDEAFAFIHGLHVGSGKSYVKGIDPARYTDFVDDMVAFVEGVSLALRHKNVKDIQYVIEESQPGKKVVRWYGEHD